MPSGVLRITQTLRGSSKVNRGVQMTSEERERLTKRIEQLATLFAAVDAFDGGGGKKPGRPKGTRGISAAGRERIRQAQKARWAKVRAAKKAKG
jgi:hypothetical protein